MIDRRSCLRAGAAIGFGFASQPALAFRIFPEDATSKFLILRNDRVIGECIQRYSRESGDFVVRQDLRFAFGPQDAPFQRFEQNLEERWRDGWLQEVISDSDDDGRLWRVRAERRDGIFGGAVNGRAFTVSGYVITTSLWHRDAPTQQALFDVTDAQVRLFQSELVGEEEVMAGGRLISAKHYAIRGEINRDIWYDADCRLVRIGASARDGSALIFELT